DGGGFADDLADDELNAEAALAAVLLGDFAEGGADGDGSGFLAAAAEAGFDFDGLAGGVLEAERMALTRTPWSALWKRAAASAWTSGGKADSKPMRLSN